MRQSLFYRIFRVFADIRTVKNSGLLMSRAYSSRYLGSEIFSRFSVAHYVLRGEKAGFFPNPFFDPLYFADKSGGGRLVDYLRDQNKWIFPTSANFDSVWYVANYHEFLASNQNPLLFFWKTGFELGHNPSKYFDTEFFRRAVARDAFEKKFHAFRLISDKIRFPLNKRELRENQNKFRDRIAITQEAFNRKKNNFLLFVQAGRAYDISWLSGRESFDVLINYYESGYSVPPNTTYVFYQTGTKVTAVSNLLKHSTGFMTQYDAVMLLDDDIEISEGQIDELFDTLVKEKLDLLQPSLTSDSQCFFPTLKQPTAGPSLSRMTAIEIMMPVISRRALETLGWVFEQSISGWLVDLLLSRKVRESFGETVALSGNVVCGHRRKVDTHDGSFYRFLRDNGLDASIEAGSISIDFAINDKITAVVPVDTECDMPSPLCGSAEHGASRHVRPTDIGIARETVSLKYIDRENQVVLDHRRSVVLPTPSNKGGSFLKNGGWLTISWFEYPSESFFLESDVYVEIANCKATYLPDNWCRTLIVRVAEPSGSMVDLRVETSDFATFKQIFVDRQYDIPILPKKPKYILDIGANIGLASVFFAGLYPDATIVSVEPDVDNYSLMEANVQSFEGRVKTVRAGVREIAGDYYFVDNDEIGRPLGAWGGQVSKDEARSSLRISCVTIDDLMKQFLIEKIDILKIDIEGSEKELFEEGASTWTSKVDCLIIETHDRLKEGCEASVRKALRGLFADPIQHGESLVFLRKSGDE